MAATRVLSVQCDLDFGDTPLGNGQQLCEIISRYNLAVMSYALTRILCMYAWQPLP